MKRTSPTATAKTVSPEDFVRIWQTSPTAEAAAQKLGIGVPTAHQRASFFRVKGIPMKRMPRGGIAPLDVAGLTALAKSLLPEGAEFAPRTPRGERTPAPAPPPARQAPPPPASTPPDRRGRIAEAATRISGVPRPGPTKAPITKRPDTHARSF